MAGTTVAEVMTRHVHVAAAWTPIARVRTIMLENGIGAVPVVLDGRVVGVVTKGSLREARGNIAADLMSPVPLLHPQQSVRRAAQLLSSDRLGHLAVVDSKGRLQGIVSRGDVLRGSLPL